MPRFPVRARPPGSQTSSIERSTKAERTQCEEGPCSEWSADYQPNCILRCQSEACYETVYGGNELEPGEIDAARSRSFTSCLTRERAERHRQERKARTGR